MRYFGALHRQEVALISKTLRDAVDPGELTEGVDFMMILKMAKLAPRTANL